jgi:hypothetical protein
MGERPQRAIAVGGRIAPCHGVWDGHDERNTSGQHRCFCCRDGGCGIGLSLSRGVGDRIRNGLGQRIGLRIGIGSGESCRQRCRWRRHRTRRPR